MTNKLTKRKEKVELKATAREKEKQIIAYFLVTVSVFVFLGALIENAFADQIVHQFKNPSFSGIATSSHYLTIDEQEKTRRDELAEDIESALKEAEREADNTTLAKFLRNLESRIYSLFLL